MVLNNSFLIGSDCVIPSTAKLENGVTIGHRVIFSGDGIVVRANSRLDAASVIGEGVVIGQGAWVRAGAVVLRSIPANAIVEGNPAQVVGYVNNTDHDQRPAPRLVDVQKINGLPRSARMPLEVGGSALYLMRRVVDNRGSLTMGEMPTEVPFSPARYFAVFGVPSVELRGEHAHRRCQQFLICLHGSCRVLLDDGKRRCKVTLDRPDMGVYMPEMIWGTQYRYSPDAVLIVFASRPYDRGRDRYSDPLPDSAPCAGGLLWPWPGLRRSAACTAAGGRNSESADGVATGDGGCRAGGRRHRVRSRVIDREKWFQKL
jgi:hypothetical protein